MEPRIVVLSGKKLVGNHGRMSLAEDRTRALWQAFMPCRGEIHNRIGRSYISMQVYDQPPDQCFTPQTLFEKWAVVEVADLDSVPAGITGYAVPAGQYAVFLHQGSVRRFDDSIHFIFHVWLPSSGHALDDRAHFTVMDENYRRDDWDGEEEIWIPIR